MISVICGRVGIHIVILFLFQAIIDQDTSKSYLYAGIVGFLFVIYSYFWGLVNYFILKISHGFRYGLITLMIKKITTLP